MKQSAEQNAPRDASIRPMAEGDIRDVVEIERMCFAMPWSYASFERELNENKNVARYLVVECGGCIIAYAGMWLVIDEGHITNVAVHPDYRGEGYGEKIVRALVTLAHELGLTYLTLEVRRGNKVAQNLYRKVGFTDVGYRKRYYEDNKEDALLMVYQFDMAE